MNASCHIWMCHVTCDTYDTQGTVNIEHLLAVLLRRTCWSRARARRSRQPMHSSPKLCRRNSQKSTHYSIHHVKRLWICLLRISDLDSPCIRAQSSVTEILEKVNPLLNSPCRMTTELTFENFWSTQPVHSSTKLWCRNAASSRVRTFLKKSNSLSNVSCNHHKAECWEFLASTTTPRACARALRSKAGAV